MTTAIRWLVVGLLSMHGFIHLLGAVKGFGWAEVSSLRDPIGPIAGAMWLLAALLVLAAAVMFAVGALRWWWAIAAVAALMSQGLIVMSWPDAKVGTAANVLLVLVAGYGFASVGPVSFAAEWEQRTQTALAATAASDDVVTEADLARLPDPIARYVRRSGAVGLPRIRDFYAELHGRIRSGPSEPWMTFTGRQLNTYGDTAQRLFYLDATMHGLPVTVFHVFDDQGASMRGKVLSLVPILDAAGPEMDRGETVTLLNDLVLFAPGALVDAPVQWRQLDSRRVRGTYSRGDQTVVADLVFGRDGDLVDFISHDRSRASTDGSSFTRLPWNTPVTRYRKLGGRRAAVEGKGMWDAPAPEGHFSYIELYVDDVAYNVTAPDIPSRASRAPMDGTDHTASRRVQHRTS